MDDDQRQKAGLWNDCGIGEIVGGVEFLEAHLLLVPYHYIIQGNIRVGIPTLYG